MLRLIRSFFIPNIGECAIQLHSLGDRFCLGTIAGIRLVTDGDYAGTNLSDNSTATIKAITGGDSVRAERKGQDAVTITPSALKTERRDLEQRRVTVDVNRSEIVEAFHKGRELLLSGEIPHLKQLIGLYVRRIEVYPDYVAVFLTYLPVLKASADEQSLSVLNDAYDGALDVENRISREALNRKKF